MYSEAAVEGVVGDWRTVWTSDNQRPEWKSFWQGASKRYGAEGCALSSNSAADWLFAVLTSIGQVVGGFAVHVRPAAYSDTPNLWGRRSGDVRSRVVAAVGGPDVLVAEASSAWAESGTSGGDVSVSDVIAAQPVVVLGLTGAPAMLASSADHTSGRWMRSGARPVEGVRSIPYPTSRYATIPLVWRRDGLLRRTDPRLAEIALQQVRSQGWSLTTNVLETIGGVRVPESGSDV